MLRSHVRARSLLVAALPVTVAILSAQLVLFASTSPASAASLAGSQRATVRAYIPIGWSNLISPSCVVRGPRAGRYARVCSHLLTRGLLDLKSYCAMRGLYGDLATTAYDVRVRVEACNLWVNGGAVRVAPGTVGQGFTETQTPGAFVTACPGRWETHVGYSIRWPDNSLTTGQLLVPVTGC
jgi:hypothetical protein